MTRHAVWCALSLAVTLLAVRPRTLPAQDTRAQAECTNYQPTFRDPADSVLRAALRRAAWPTAEFDKLLVDSGPVATLRRVRLHGKELVQLAQAGATDAPSAWAAVDGLLQDLADSLQQGKGSVITKAQFPYFGALRATPSTLGGVIVVGQRLRFEEADRKSSVAICAVAGSANALLEFLAKAELDRTAETYAALGAQWTLFGTSAYSMTWVERLAASCRLPVLSLVLSPTSRCQRRQRTTWALAELTPPRWRTVFAHPSAGLEPILKADSAYRTATLVEWYGILRLQYTHDAIRTWGLSVAHAYFAADRFAPGGILHTPLGRIGVFDGRGGRTLIMLSGDLLRWQPQARAALEALNGRNLDAIRRSVQTGAVR